MDLIRQINETTSLTDAEDAIFESNCSTVAVNAEVELQELVESVIEWLGGIADQAQQGSLGRPAADNTAAMADHADKMKGTAEVMGAIMALTDPDMAEAMNVKNPNALLKIASSGHPQSNKAIEYLRGVGRGEAAGFAKRAAQLLQGSDDNAIMSAIKGLQNKAKKALLIQQPTQSQQPAATMGESAPGLLNLSYEMNKSPKI